MASTSILFLRSVPESQAKMHDDYLDASTQARVSDYLSGQARLAQIGKLVTATQNALQGLQDKVNQTEATIRKAASVTVSDVPEAFTNKIRWAFDNNVSLQDICQQLVEDNDRTGFAALHQVLPWAARANKLPGNGYTNNMIRDAQDSIAAYEKQLMTEAELTKLAEVQECDISMPLVRLNFTQLFDFLQKQTLPSSVAGQFIRLRSIWRWQGLPTDSQVKGMLNLGDDFGGQFKAASNVPSTPDIEVGKSYNVSRTNYILHS